MKKNLFSICMLLLCTCILSSKTFAQGDSGGSSDGMQADAMQGSSIDGGGTAPTFTSPPPPGLSNLKRNNGNASSAYGVAEARLTFLNNAHIPSDLKLVKVTDLAGKVDYTLQAILPYTDKIEIIKNYISYSLGENLPPAKKLMFYFTTSSGTSFKIPEL